jgi:uncharacterized membrane protein YccC
MAGVRMSLGRFNERLSMQNRTLGLGILALVALIILYCVWPYLVGFLTVVGAAQVYRFWRNHYGR